MWIDYDEKNRLPYLDCRALRESMGESVQHVKVTDHNVTTGEILTGNVSIAGQEFRLNISDQIHKMNTPGLHHVTLTVGNTPQHFWFYMPKAAENDKYSVRITMRTQGDLLKLRIRTEVNLAHGRLYYTVDDQAFRFSLPSLSANQEHYFLLHKPERKIKFWIDESGIPTDVSCPVACKGFGLGINIFEEEEK